MNALKTFKDYGAKMLAMTALLTLGTMAAKSQTIQRSTRDTLTNVKGARIVKDGKVGTSDTLHIRTTKLLDKKTPATAIPASQIKTKIVTKEVANPARKQYVKDHTPKTHTQADEEGWKNPAVRKAYYDRLNKIPATIIKQDTISAVVQPPAQVSGSSRLSEKEKADTIIIENNFEKVVNIKPYRELSPWRVSIGLGKEKSLGPVFDPNTPATSFASRSYDVDPGYADYAYAQVRTPQFSTKGIGSWTAAFARLELHKKKQIAMLASNEAIDDELHDVTVDQANLRNNLKVGVKFGPMIGKGFLKVNPHIEFGGMATEKTKVTAVPSTYGRPFSLSESQQKTLAVTTSLFYGVGLDIFGDFGARKHTKIYENTKPKPDVKKDHGFFFEANLNAFGTTQTSALHDPVSGLAIHGVNKHVNASVGIGWRIR